jgi:NADH-quinone oxidoreductase subunit F
MPAEQLRAISANFNRPGYDTSLATYRRHGGYTALAKAITLAPADICAEVKTSGLRGRGGAGFPTGVKWGFLKPKPGQPVYLVVNADESEPGTFKDRQLIYHDPHQIIEGALITARAINAARIFIYIRGEFQHGAQILEHAITEARAAGLCGERAGAGSTSGTAGSASASVPVEIIVHRGGGCYVCGEENAQIRSLAGGRGYPRLKPPYFPAVLGLYDCPTIVNNAETMAQVRRVLEIGAGEFAKTGVTGDTGTRIWSVSGHVRRPGNYELEAGKITLGELLNDLCGGPREGHRFKAVIPGGSSSQVLRFGETFNVRRPDGSTATWNVEDIPLDFDSLRLCGSGAGSGGMIVMDDSVEMLQALANLNAFYAHESCGQCTPCREGSRWLSRITRRCLAGGGRPEDVPLLKSAADQIAGMTICAHGEAVAWPVQSGVAKFGDEYADTIRRRAAHLPATGPTLI